MQLIQLQSMSGCGTHLVLDLYGSVGIGRVDGPIHLLQALFLARKDPVAPCRMADCTGFTAAETVEKLSRELSVAPPADLSSDESCIECFGNSLKGVGRERMVFGHHYYFSNTLALTVPGGGDDLVWTLRNRDDLQDMLERAMISLDIDFRQVAVLRNPVDIYLSQTERFKDSKTFKKEGVEKIIGEFFRKIADRPIPGSFPVVRYEDLCRAQGDDLSSVLADLHFSPADIENANRNLIHGGNLEKWRLYPSSQVSVLAGSLREHMEAFGYEARPSNRLVHATSRAVESKTLDKKLRCPSLESFFKIR